MKKFTAPILLALSVLLLSPTEGWSLPPCPGSPTREYIVWRRWTNCVGTLTYPNSYKFVGEWKDGNYHGQGTKTYADGRAEEGIWKNGLFQYARKAPSPRRAKKRAGGLPPCPGSPVPYYFRYLGKNWTNCVGTMTYTNGDKYVGEYRNGKSHGQGTFTWKAGHRYVGEYRNGKSHGQGTFTWKAGHRYVGEWKDGDEHGQGTFTWANGRVWKEGIWKDGKFQYAKKTPTPSEIRRRKEKERIARPEKRLKKKRERLALKRKELELRREEARLNRIEKELEQKKRPPRVTRRTPRTARRTSPAAQDDWRSSASGFYLKSTTHIMTNFHVIDKAKVIQVSFPKGGRYRGRVVAKDERNDLAVIKLLKMKPRRSGFGFRFGARVRVGDKIHALGYPLGASLSRYPSMVSGEINATRGMGDNLSQFRTNANINKGNSGGPIVNDKGELVGVALAGLVQRGVEGVRFGIKATAASLVLEQVPAMEKFGGDDFGRRQKV